MKYQIEDQIYDTPIDITMQFIGGKWKIHIINVLKSGTKRFKDISKSIPVVTDKMLTKQLKEMEKEGIVSREVFANDFPVKVEYTLTEFGKTLLPITLQIEKWGKELGETVGTKLK